MPVVLVVVGPLSVSARSTAEAMGFPDLSVAELHTPLHGLTRPQIAALARPAARQAIRRLVR